jgi:TonB family protein
LQTVRPLGKRTIDGLETVGSETSTAFSANNDEKSGVATYEAWVSAELHLPVLVRTADPRIGDWQISYKDIRRQEPDPDLFSPPPDYKGIIVGGAVTIAYPPSTDQYRDAGFLPAKGISTPKVSRKVEPHYTEEAKRAGITGEVLLGMLIDETGQSHDIRVVKSLDRGLDLTALEAVRQWQFTPGMREGVAVPIAATVAVIFRLR